MTGLAVFLTCLVTIAAIDVFRTELFPEQLEQQQVQFQQIGLQQQIQNLQRQQQVAPPGLQESLRIQQDILNNQLRDLQDYLLKLQQRIQDQLGGGGRFDQPLREESFSPKIVNRVQPRPQVQKPPPQFQQPAPQRPQVQIQQQPQVRPSPPPKPPRDTQPQANGVDIPCSTQSGEAGFCRPLIKCLSFYAELPELKRQPCQLGVDELGVCCPLRMRPSGHLHVGNYINNYRVGYPLVLGISCVDPGLGQDDLQAHSAGGGNRKNSGVLQAPPPPPVVIPPFTPQQLNQAATNALQKLQERFNFVAQLFAQRVFINPGTASASHLEFFPTSNVTLQQGDTAQKSVQASVDLVNEFKLSPDQGKFALPTFSVLNTVIGDTCPRSASCQPFKYRTPDGSCNNLNHDRWGKAGTALQRILPPKYGDGVNSPRTTESNGKELPSTRLVSTHFAQEADAPSNNYTLMVMQFGQFLDHDLTHTPISRGQSGSGISCCRDSVVIPENLRHPDCFHIELPRTDKIFSPFGERCMEFVRSLPAPRPECNFGPREQMNQITGWLDGSNIYGSDQGSQVNLREFKGGRLQVQNFQGKPMLPANSAECSSQDNNLSCFRAGDGRVNEQPNLALMHTLWMREHNRVVRELGNMHPDWSDEALFQETRRIVVAEIQHITYNEFLPIILGRPYMDKSQISPKDNGWTQLYDPDLNGGITNVFATAAFRFGHSLIQSNMHGYGRFGNVRENLLLSKQHFAPFVLYNEGAVDDMVRGLSSQSCQKFDRFFSKEITDHLFQGDLDLGLDLFALNLQRGRDHGLPPYNDWREVCGLPRARDWQSLQENMDRESITRLAQLYGSVDEVDLFAGAVAERPAPDAMLGPTFVCLVGDQFSRLRRGDRFFYEESNQPSTFTQNQLEQLKKASLARILCDNSEDLTLTQPLAFVQPSFLNQRVACSSQSIPIVQLHPWAQEKPAVA